MSEETAGWLNTMALIGFTDQRGHAWHYRAADQGEEPNHYAGPVPVDDVRRRLFHWKVAEGDVTSRASVLNADGVECLTIGDPARKAMLRPPRALGPDDPGTILGIFKAGYEGHETVTTPEGVAFRPHLLATTSFDGSLSTTFKRAVQNVVCDNTHAAAMSEAG